MLQIRAGNGIMEVDELKQKRADFLLPQPSHNNSSLAYKAPGFTQADLRLSV